MKLQRLALKNCWQKEDDLLLNQVAGAGLFGGLTTATNSTAFAAPALLALGVDLANNYDVLVAAWTQARNAKVSPNMVLCNPSDYAKMILTKNLQQAEHMYLVRLTLPFLISLVFLWCHILR